MCGAFTDNQPDFSWLHPGEEKRFQQVFMPYKDIGPAKNASRDAVINLDVEDDNATVGVYLSSQRDVTVKLQAQDALLFERELALGPEQTLCETIPLPAGVVPHQLTLSVMARNEPLVSYTPAQDHQCRFRRRPRRRCH